MKKHITTLGLGGTLLGLALLVACGGGGGVGSTALPNTPSNNTPLSQLGKTQIKIAIPIAPSRPGRHHASRNAKYVSTGAEGLQIVVTSTGSNPVSQTIYANIASPSPLCAGPQSSNTPAGTEETCTITVPTLGASETIVATQVSQTPIPNATPGYGSGFSNNATILAVGSVTATAPAAGGVNTVALGMGVVAAQLFNCSGYMGSEANPHSFGIDGNTNPTRLVVTAGVATSGQFSVEFGDSQSNWYDALPSPAPGFSPVPQKFTDVNGSPTPLTLVSSSSSVTLAVLPIEAGQTTPSPSNSPATTGSVSIPDDGSYWNDCEWYFNVIVGALATPAPGVSPPTITMSNNLVAPIPSPFASGQPPNYGSSLVYSVVAIGASPSNPVVMTGIPATVTGIDVGALAAGMGAESAFGTHDGLCTGSASATVASNGAINTTTWQQSFTVTRTAGPGSCTFYLYDVDTGVLTNPITVNVGI